MTIISSKLIKINDFTYSLQDMGENSEQLFLSIKRLLKVANIDLFTKTITFSAEHVTTLKKYIFSQPNNIITHKMVVLLIYTISKQIKILQEDGYGLYGFDLDKILLIDNIFVVSSSEYILPLSNNYFVFSCPFNRPYFSSPEIIKLTKLPSKIHYKSCFYSLGLLVIYSLLNKYLLVGNEIQSQTEIESLLSPFENTKLYWFLKRAINEDINDRRLMLL